MKQLMTLALLLLSCHVLYCQVSFGVKAGFNVNALIRDSYNTTGMAYSPYFSSDPVTGFHVGGFAQIRMIGKLQLQPELRIVQRGTNHGENSERIRVTYAELPVLLLYNVTPWMSLEGGPVFSYTMAGKIGRWESHDTFERSTYGAQLGMNFHLSQAIALGASYYHGMKPALRQKFFNSDNSILAYDKYYNRGVQISLLYTIVTLGKSSQEQTAK